MQRYFISLLVLATAAVSSSNVLPMSVTLNKEMYGIGGQHKDNIIRNRYHTTNVLDEIFKMYIGPEDTHGLDKVNLKYDDNNQNDDVMKIENTNDNYDDEGFRKEQWHNYPRQLDRLTYNTEKKNFDPDPNNRLYTDEVVPDIEHIDDASNEFAQDSISDTDNDYDIVLPAPDSLLILKIRLACLNSNQITRGLKNSPKDETNVRYRNENPDLNVIKVKREGVSSKQDSDTENSSTRSKFVNKRIFSLWSRLQSLNHKGHELLHRRHLYAFYGLPDSDGGRALTAETRDSKTFMRPPGSPLRWG